MRTTARAALLAIALVGCSAGVSPPSGAAEGATPTPRIVVTTQALEATPTGASAPSSSPTPVHTPALAPAALEVVSESIRAIDWEYGLYRPAITVTVKNTGEGWLSLGDVQSFTVLTATGKIRGDGIFILPMPRELGPGETGYFLSPHSSFDIERSETLTLDFEQSWQPIDEPTDVTLSATNVNVEEEPVSDLYLTFSAFISNTTVRDARNVKVGVIFLDAKGSVIAGDVSNRLVSTVAAGGRATAIGQLLLPRSVLKLTSKISVMAYGE